MSRFADLVETMSSFLCLRLVSKDTRFDAQTENESVIRSRKMTITSQIKSKRRKQDLAEQGEKQLGQQMIQVADWSACWSAVLHRQRRISKPIKEDEKHISNHQDAGKIWLTRRAI